MVNAAINDAKYRADFAAAQQAGHHKNMTVDQYISLRRAEDGLEPFITDKPPVEAATPAALNPLAEGL